MIRLFRHDGLELMLNVDMIREIEPGPPTVIVLVSGERVQVKNTPADVLTKIHAYRKGIADENLEFDPAARKGNREMKPPFS